MMLRHNESRKFCMDAEQPYKICGCHGTASAAKILYHFIVLLIKRGSIIQVRNCRVGPAKRPGLFCPSVPGNFLKCRNKMVPLFGSLGYALAGKRIKEILVAKHRHALAVLQIQRGLQAPHQNVLAALPLVLAAAQGSSPEKAFPKVMPMIRSTESVWIMS